MPQPLMSNRRSCRIVPQAALRGRWPQPPELSQRDRTKLLRRPTPGMRAVRVKYRCGRSDPGRGHESAEKAPTRIWPPPAFGVAACGIAAAPDTPARLSRFGGNRTAGAPLIARRRNRILTPSSRSFGRKGTSPIHPTADTGPGYGRGRQMPSIKWDAARGVQSPPGSRRRTMRQADGPSIWGKLLKVNVSPSLRARACRAGTAEAEVCTERFLDTKAGTATVYWGQSPSPPGLVRCVLRLKFCGDEV